MDNVKINARFEAIEKRLNLLENDRFEQKETTNENNKQDFKGLAGGIRLLINSGYFDLPKSLDEIWDELKRQVYHYPKSSVSKLLSVNFTKEQKILNRIEEAKKWKYVIRK